MAYKILISKVRRSWPQLFGWRISLLSRILLATFAIVLFSSGFLAIFQISTLRREVLNQAIRRAEDMVISLQVILETAGEKPSLSDFFRRFGSREEVQDLAVVDIAGRRRFSLTSEAAPLSKWEISWILSLPEVYDPSRGPVHHRLSPDGSLLEIASPVTLPGSKSGGIYLVIRMDEANRAIAAARQGLMLALVFDTVLLLVGFTVFLYLVLIRPIRGMVGVVDRVRDGDFTARVERPGGGELADLGMEINRMVTRLREMIIDLQKVNEALTDTRRELIEAEKLATIGRIAAGLAHEIGNPLSALIGYVRLFESQSSRERRKEYLDRMGKELERIHNIITELVNLSRPGEVTPGWVKVTDVLSRTAGLMTDHPDFKGISVVLDVPEDLSHPALEAGRLQQVIVNLMLNAAQSMADGGTLTLRAEEKDKAVEIEVTDTGRGIPPEEIEKIFEPFYTTKDPGRGLGLGLSISRRIVNLLGGTLAVTSTVGKGSVFSLRFPFPKEENKE